LGLNNATFYGLAHLYWYKGEKTMKYEDLIKKLENLKTPQIELRGHKQALKMALLNSARFRERTIMDWPKVLAPVSAAVLLIAVVGFFTVIQPQLQMDQSKEIARNDLKVQELMEEYGLRITEVKLQNSQAFVLLVAHQHVSVELYSADAEDVGPAPRPPQWEFHTPSNITFSGYIIKIDLVEERATGFSKVDSVTALKDIKLEDIDFAQFEPSGGGP
jgi:hypothetical protein